VCRPQLMRRHRTAAQPFVQPDALRLASPASGRRLTQSLAAARAKPRMSQRFFVLRHRAPNRATSAASHARCQASRSQSMKVEGASRRSAAPGSQSVGVAEYGDDVRTQPYAAMDLTANGNYRGARLMPWHASVLPPKARGHPSRSFVPLPSSPRSPEPVAKPARTRRNAALPVQVSLVAHCAILRQNSQSRQVAPSLRPRSESPSQVPYARSPKNGG
jgi:hypothetical protein